jgi:radical SAM protein with 4Fe4S-binding SPASM domain
MIIDKNIPRKEKITKDRLQFLPGTKTPLMSVVEISNSGMCNRKCSFCPRSDPNYPEVNEFISDELHKKIFFELSELKFQGMIIYSGYVEPLLNKNIFNNIKEARSFLPNANIEVITNGDALNLERLKKLFDSGLTTLLISVYDGPEDEEKFYTLCQKANLKKEQYVIRNRYLPPEKDFGLTFSNRSGNLLNAQYPVPPLEKSLNLQCNYPAYTFFIDYNGDVLMCSHDWGKKYILGNVKKEKILDIWLGNKFTKARKLLLKKNREFSPCNKCDVKGDLIGKEHAKKWQEII